MEEHGKLKKNVRISRFDRRYAASLTGKGTHTLYHCPTFRRTIVQSTFETQWYPVPSSHLPTAATLKHIVPHFVKSLGLLGSSGEHPVGVARSSPVWPKISSLIPISVAFQSCHPVGFQVVCHGNGRGSDARSNYLATKTGM